MTKLLLLTLTTLLAFSTPRTHAEDLYDYRTPREAQDWCTISIRTKPANGPALPLVLLIGDSITVRYASEVGAALKDKAYVSLLGTTKASRALRCIPPSSNPCPNPPSAPACKR